MPLRKPCKSIARPVGLQVQCTHTTMTRVYGPHHLCSNCLKPGMFGWIYQCTQDKEIIIDEAIAHGDLACCDEIGLAMVDHINAQRNALPTHHDKFSFLEGLTSDEMSKYRPDQIATLLRQKEKVQSLIQRQRMSHNAASLLAHDGLLDLSDPLPNPYEYRKLLDAVAQGHLLPSAAAGFGFHAIAGRPVTDANILRNIGQRPVPPPTASDKMPRMSWINSSLCIMELLERQMTCATDLSKNDSYSTNDDDACAEMLTPFSSCRTLEHGSQTLQDPSRCSVAAEPLYQSSTSSLFDVHQRPSLEVHGRQGTESSYSDLHFGLERGISDMITAV